MLSPERNARLTQIGPGTPCGELLRRYWHPLCAVAELTDKKPKKKVKILDERLLAFRMPDGEFACIAENCAHRRCSLYYGFVEDGGIRCAYHGWKYAGNGQCIDQPFEPEKSVYKNEIRQKSYPVQELGGLLFVYMGPQPVPLLPRWDVLVRTDGLRRIEVRPTLNCNWMQIQENTADTVHTYYLHGHMMETHGRASPVTKYYYRPIVDYDFRNCEWGIEKKCFYGGDHPEEEIRPPLLFPNMLRIPEGKKENLHWRIPVDDTHTAIIVMSFRPFEKGQDTSPQESVPVDYIPSDIDENGEYNLASFFSHDRMAWETQGEIFDRSKENLAVSDRGIVMFRRMLEQQIEVVEKGGEPMALVRDPEKNRIISFDSHSVNRLSGSTDNA